MIKDGSPPNRAVDPAKWAFDIGCHLLALYGHSGRPARAIVARWLKRAGDPLKLIDLLARAGSAERGDILAFIDAALKPEAPPPAPERVDTDAVLRYRVEHLRRIGFLHLLSPDQEARARAKGWLPPENRRPETSDHLPQPPAVG